jgi:hypothetical protein
MLRKLLVILAFLGLAGLSVGKVWAQDSGDISLTSGDRNGNRIYVYNSDAVSHSTGTLVIYTNGGGTYPGISISTSITANDGLVAGVIVEKTIAANGWGWIQTRGYAVVNIGVANTAGDSLVTSTTAGKAGVYSVAQATGTAANQSNILGVFATALETTTSSTSVKCMLRGAGK